MYGIFVGLGLGLGILLLNFIWQLFRNFGLGIGLEAEAPLKLTFRAILFMGLVFFSQDIVSLILDIGGTPYEWIVDASLPPIQFASFMSVITVVIGGTVGGSVLLIILAWNYIKLLFEAAERYILLGVLVFTAPVAFALGGSQSTSNIFKSWCRMLGGQIFLLVMNAWCLKLFTNMFGEFIANPLGTGDRDNLFVWFLCAIAFLKVSQKIDSFMAGLGISVGHIGGVVTGTASQNGVISGEKAVDAFRAYMGPEGGIPAAAAEEADAASEMQPTTVTPGASIPSSPDAAAETEADTAPSLADNLQTGENQIAMSKEDAAKTPDAMKTETEGGYSDVPGCASRHIPPGPEGLAPGSESFSEIPPESSAAGQGVGIPAGMEQGSVTAAGTKIPAGASISTGETGSEPAPSESSADTKTVLSGTTTIPAAAAAAIPSGGSGRVSEDTYSPGAQSAAFAGQYAGKGSASPYTEPPTFRNIEMGSGRITGTEISPQHPTGIQFAMYHAGQYTQPEGKFTTVTSKDGEKWYKQYAVPTVERTPVRTETDKRTQQEKVICDEKIVQKLPRAPARRDR